MRLSDDYKGADCLAIHIDGEKILRAQVTGRLTVENKYVGKDIWVAFPYKSAWYMFPHDEGMKYFLKNGRSDSFSTGYLSKAQTEFLQQYRLNEK